MSRFILATERDTVGMAHRVRWEPSSMRNGSAASVMEDFGEPTMDLYGRGIDDGAPGDLADASSPDG